MIKHDAMTRILAVVGTLLVWFPILAPILLSSALIVQESVFRFDYLMPAELFPAAFGGGCLLIWAALRARSRQILIGGGLAIGVVFLIGAQVLAVATGLSSGETEPTGWPWAIVLGSIGGYSIALVAIGIGGVLLLRDIYSSHRPPKESL